MQASDAHYRIGVVSFYPFLASASVASPTAYPNVDAVVREDDTHHVLSADPTFREPTVHPVRIYTKVLDAVPSSLGQINTVSSKPLILRAVVHELSRTPSVRLLDVKNATADLFVKYKDLEIGSLSMPLLGTVYGRLDSIDVLSMLRELSPTTGEGIRIFLELSREQGSMLKEHWADWRRQI